MKKDLTSISLEQNDLFSNFRGLDLQELLVEIINFDLVYRTKLNLPDELSFGVEIEYEHFPKKIIDRFIRSNFCNWESKEETTVNKGGEVTSPVLYDEVKYWKELQQICKYLRRKKVSTVGRTGGHVHIGANILEENYHNWIRFLKIYMLYEHIIFHFVYGDKIIERSVIKTFACPVSLFLYRKIENLNNLSSLEDIKELCSYIPKGSAINFRNTIFDDILNKNLKNTVEFRSPNATTNAIIWQNNINLFAKLMIAVTRYDFDEDFIEYKINTKKQIDQNGLFIYREICLKDALEFVDLIFDNNEDKIYFLRQYFKNFEDSYKAKKISFTKKFTK